MTQIKRALAEKKTSLKQKVNDDFGVRAAAAAARSGVATGANATATKVGYRQRASNDVGGSGGIVGVGQPVNVLLSTISLEDSSSASSSSTLSSSSREEEEGAGRPPAIGDRTRGLSPSETESETTLR